MDANLLRELDKARDVLTACKNYLAKHAEANAALHCSERVMYSPLHARVESVLHGLDLVLVADGAESTDTREQ